MTDTSGVPGPRQALRRDLTDGAQVLAAAFQEDPWFSWLYPEEARRPEQLRAWFELVIGRAFPKGHTYVTDGGFIDWIPPDVHFPEADDLDAAVALLSAQIGERTSTALGIIGGVGACFPDEPRFHCVYVGVRPERQGTGTGTGLLRRVLDVCDREQVPASLTSTNDHNLPFYRQLGFTEIGAVPIADTGRSMRPMWRSPMGRQR